MQRPRVCIVGGGASGLVCARVLASEDYQCQPTIFEQNSFAGGQWNYNADGTSESSAVYKYLRTNLPCSVMQFTDFPFPNSPPESHVSVKEMHEYLVAYTKHYQLEKYLLLNTKINSIDETFTVTYTVRFQSENDLPQRADQKLLEKHENYAIFSEQFDAVCVANGHYSDMYIPSNIPGFDSHTFPIIHSRSYREPECYENKSIIVVGASHSGIDICGELTSVAKQVILSMKEENMEQFNMVLNLHRQSGKHLCIDDLTKNFSIASTIERIDKDTVYFQNQTSFKPDLIIFATGYNYHMPFLQGKLQVDENRLLNNHYVYPLYKQLFHADYPDGRLSFLAIPVRIIPFPSAEIQSHIVARILTGKLSLPTREQMYNELEHLDLPQNHNYHCVDMIKYANDLFKLMSESDKYFNYRLTIDDCRDRKSVV